MLFTIVFYFLFAHGFIHKNKNKNHGHPLSKCNGVENLLGVQEISSNPEKLKPGKDFSIHIQGKLQSDIQYPLCRSTMKKNVKLMRPCDKEGVTCPMNAGQEWSSGNTLKIPGKARAMAGRKVNIRLECQESTADATEWDNKAKMVTCIDTSIEVSLWLEETQAPAAVVDQTEQSEPATAHSSTIDMIENPWIIAPVAGIILGFILTSAIIYWRIKKRSRGEVDEIWSATLVQRDIYMKMPSGKLGV